MQILGPDNPLCDLGQYRAALAKITELSGIKDVSKYFKPIQQGAAQQAAQHMANNKPPDPQQMLVEIEKQKAQIAAVKAQADVQMNQQKLDIQREEAIMADARERERIQADAMLRAAEIQAKYGAQIDVAHLERMFDHDREVILAQIKADSAERQAQMQMAARAQQMQQQPQGNQPQ